MKNNPANFPPVSGERFREPLSKELEEALREQDIIALRKRMHKVMEPDEGSRLLSVATWVGVAAVICIGIFIWGSPFAPKANSNALYSNYYQTYEMHGIVRGELPADNPVAEASVAYAMGNYALARTLFYKSYQEDESNYKALFYLALSCMELHQFQEAKAYWERLEHDNPKVLFADAVAWYHALTLVKTGNKQKARNLLTSLSVHETGYADEAEKLLEKL
ncbi:MAG: tetratricopeptide repeat protein [Bacteroidota bacterium]